jgi:nucleoside-diphosphate-sugar epimerase
MKSTQVVPQVVDVRDVAQLLRYVIEHPDETDGERYLASAGVSHPQAIADVLREEGFEGIVEGEKGKGYSADYQSMDGMGGYDVDSGKARALLEGGEWIGFRKSVVDTARTFVGLDKSGR